MALEGERANAVVHKRARSGSLTVVDDGMRTSDQSSSDTSDSMDKTEDGGLLPSVGPQEVGDCVYVNIGVDRCEAGRVVERRGGCREFRVLCPVREEGG